MFIIQKINGVITRAIGFFQYYYAAFMRNYYPCKLDGEKHSEEANEAIVVYHKAKNRLSLEIPIKELLSNPTLIADFQPEEALKIGYIALEQFVLEVPLNERTLKFNQIKHIMLNSTCDVTQNFNFRNLFFETTDESTKHCDINHLNKNIYPCRLVGVKSNNITSETRIIFTVLGKRDGYDTTLSELIKNKDLLNKFHPTEAVKFGFIHMGDTLLGSIDSTKK